MNQDEQERRYEEWDEEDKPDTSNKEKANREHRAKDVIVFELGHFLGLNATHETEKLSGFEYERAKNAAFRILDKCREILLEGSGE